MASLKHVNLIIMKSVWRVASTLLLFLTLNCCKDFSSIMNTNDEHNCIVPTDTTSHDFTWVVDTLGDYGSSLRDVAIISENEVWAVGNIVVSQPEYNLYGSAIWDGVKWNLKKLMSGTSNVTPKGILAFFEDDIWFASGSIYHWNVDTTELSYLRDIEGGEIIGKLWGPDNNNLYGIGSDGFIVHYDGNSWTHQTSGTTRDLNDIAGYTDPKTGQTRIWIAGTQVLLCSEDGDFWEVVWDQANPILPERYTNPTTLFLQDPCFLLVSVWNGSGSRLYRSSRPNFNDFLPLASYNSFIRAMDGSHINNITLAGDFNAVFHYNGNTIKEYPQLSGYGQLLGVAQSEQSVYIVGYVGSGLSRALVIRGVK
jgi:hypothetical protein